MTRLVIKVYTHTSFFLELHPAVYLFLQVSEGRYDWSQKTQGFILSSFFIGYTISHVPGGVLAEMFGGKLVLVAGIFSTAVFTLFTPFAIKYGNFCYYNLNSKKNGFYICVGNSNGLIALRILMGLGEGTTFPALSVLLAQWIPPSERSRLGTIVFGGGQVI